MKIGDTVLQGYEDTELFMASRLPEDFTGTVSYDDLPQWEGSGVLKACFHTEDGRFRQIYSEKDNHVGVIAATRLGKTTSYVIPTILSFSRMKQKKSMVISDPKGELYRATAHALREEGYDVRLINFRDCDHSEGWNPLTAIFRKYSDACNSDRYVQTVETPDGDRFIFRGKTYSDQHQLDEDLRRFTAVLIEDVANDVDDFAQMAIVTESEKDPYWEDSARELLKAFLWGMLEDSNPNTPPNPRWGRIMEDTFSFRTLFALSDSFNEGDGNTYNDGGYFTQRGAHSRAYQYAKNSILENAATTRRCIVSVFNTVLAPFRDSTVRLITSCNTLDLNLLTGERPVAVFVHYRDELKTHYRVISLFVQDAYRLLIEYATAQKNGRLAVPFYFILDEFGNFPPMRDFETTISACAGRNIFFMLIIQSYAQLNSVYGANVAEIIRDNLNMHVFFGSNNPKTLEEFSRECGEKTRISPLSALNGSGKEIEQYQLETVALLPKSRLSHLAEGECVITEANCGYVLLSRLERCYLCKEFCIPESDASAYESPVDLYDPCFDYCKPNAVRYMIRR